MADMDSANSGSIQSSSTGGGGGGGGGEEQEYESHGGRGETTSFPAAFFNNQTVNYQVAPMDNARLLQLYSLNNNNNNNNNNGSPSSLNNMFDHHQQHGQVHFGSLESANFNTGKFIGHDTNNLDSIIWANKFGPISTPGFNNNLQQPQLGPGSDNSTRSSNLNASGGSGGPCRNPKKRSRASRRAPTTVLTTDTSNFRQMVQEFTGIPAPPFSSFPTRSRLDLFGGMGMGSGSGIGPASYLLRPFAQKTAPPSNVPMLSFQSLLQQSSSLIQDSSKGSGSEPDNWGELQQGLGLTQVNDGAGNLSVPTVREGVNNSERVDVVISSTTENHVGGGGGMVADSWICSSD